MGQATKIEWATSSWNPITGCSPVSPGCANCYAKRMAHRLRGRYGYAADEPFRVTPHNDKLDEPLHWRKPRRVFVCSMGDLFHPDVPDKWIESVCDVMALCPQHEFYVLTKRPERMARYGQMLAGLLPNVWLGVSVEDQKRANERLPYLARLDAAGWHTFVSCEPLLGPVDLAKWRHVIDWVIAGGETGPRARPMDRDWARSLRNQARAARVPFFFKQTGKGRPTPPDLLVRELPEGLK